MHVRAVPCFYHLKLWQVAHICKINLWSCVVVIGVPDARGRTKAKGFEISITIKRQRQAAGAGFVNK